MLDDSFGEMKDREAAARWYRLAAMQGHASAQYRLGRLHARGDGVERSMVETFAWWKMASVNGHIRARWDLKKIADFLDVTDFREARKLIHQREATAVLYR
jgi:TPR repeat protein